MRPSLLTLESTFNPRSNSLNAIRLVLAALVIVSHSFALGGYGPEPEAGGLNLGTWAVVGFFGLSGFLITRSRMSRAPVHAFYIARFLRIYPGFVVALLACSFVFAPITVWRGTTGTFELADQWGFVVNNLLLYPPEMWQLGIGTTLSETPFPTMWNGALWTLFWEASCYVGIGLLATIVRRRGMPVATLAGFVLLTMLGLANQTGVVTLGWLWPRVLVLGIAFFAGAVAYVYADRIQVGNWFVIVIGVGLLVVTLFGLAGSLGPFMLTVLLIRAGTVLPLHKVGRATDISYGLYIYGWPVQQLVAITFRNHDLPLVGFMALSLAGAACLGWLSWTIVEKPALRLRPRPKSLQVPGATPRHPALK